MRTAISPGQWQPWTAVSASLSLISMAYSSRRAATGPKALCSLPFIYYRDRCKAPPFSASPKQHIWKLVAGNRTAVLHGMRWEGVDSLGTRLGGQFCR